MSVDDLFQRDAPVRPTPNRLSLITVLLGVAAPLNFLGIACFTAIPGVILTLLAWQLADEELARVESGALGPALRPKVQRLRAVAFGQLGFCALSLMTQMFLYGIGVYDQVLTELGVPEPVQQGP